ncbi:MAG: hypothetical protein U0359_35385 [Byssovorax sp.]
MKTSPFARRTLAALLLCAAGCTEAAPAPAPKTAPSPPATAPAPSATASADPWAERGVPRIVSDARRLMDYVRSPETKRFLDHARALPGEATRVLYRDEDKSHYYTEAEAAALPPAERQKLVKEEQTEEDYYNTHYGSPLSYARPLDILFSRGVTLPQGSKMLDFGYGYIGHLRLLASMGVNATGVDVWPLLRALYSKPEDQGAVTGPAGEKGSIRLFDGHFPGDAKIAEGVGHGYDLVISKNVLKKGYIHPDRPVPNPKRQIELGVSDEVFLKAVSDALRPGGHFLIYNICPAPTPPDKPFVPYSDGRSPFTRAQWEAAGFEVLVFDQDDTDSIRDLGHRIGWDQPYDGEPGMDLKNDLSVLYTLVRKPDKR